MNDTEKAELNRQIAEMLGAQVLWHEPKFASNTGWKLRQPAVRVPGLEYRTPPTSWQEDGLYMTEEFAWSKVHNYAGDCRATDLVRQWLEGQRLTIEERSYEHHFEATGEYGRRYGCLIRGRGHEVWAASFREERGTALCIAALFYSKSEERKEWVRHMESAREESPNA